MKEIFKNKIVQFILVLIVIIFVFSVIFSATFVVDSLKSGFYYITNPISSSFYSVSQSLKQTFSSIFRFSNIARENEILKSRLVDLESKNSKLAELEAQNEILRKQLGIGKLNNKKDLIAGQVIGSSPTSFREVLVVDKGRNDGVKKGDSVVSNKFLLGKVEKVYPHSSHIQLITSTDSVVNGLIQETRARGIVKGQIGYGLKMESIPKQAKIEAGQRVITSGLGGGFPKGLIIGYIDETISSEGDIFSSANLTNPINFYDLEIVFILSDK